MVVVAVGTGVLGRECLEMEFEVLDFCCAFAFSLSKYIKYWIYRALRTSTLTREEEDIDTVLSKEVGEVIYLL